MLIWHSVSLLIILYLTDAMVINVYSSDVYAHMPVFWDSFIKVWVFVTNIINPSLNDHTVHVNACSTFAMLPSITSTACREVLGLTNVL